MTNKKPTTHTMRVADYIAQRLYEAGVTDVFMVSGGGMMFLSDGLAQHKKLRVVCNHHEQASAMAAVGYAKYTGGLGAAYFSTGCGSTNALTGLLTAWQDSVSCVFISGQVKRKETSRNSGLPLRQVGTQEADIISVVSSLTKYAVMVNEPEEIAYHLDKALHLARSGRPGPVWIDVPMDVQGALIDTTSLKRFKAEELAVNYKVAPIQSELAQLQNLLTTVKRPVIIAGQGIRLSQTLSEFRTFVEKHKIPVVSPYLGVSVLPTNHPLYIGVIGIKGSRAGNLAMQNADLIIALGSRLSVTAIGYEYHLFAREAKKVVVDIDPVEHQKKTITIDLFINADLRNFFPAVKDITVPKNVDWVKRCQVYKEKYPVCLPEYKKYKKEISFYYFVDALSRLMDKTGTVISDAGSAFYVTTQAINLTHKQRYLTSGGQAEMGFSLPGAIGASAARGYKDVYAITGDGSLQMNIQELQTLKHYDIPVKLFVWNNDGYLSIRTTQNKFFAGRLIGADKKSGVSLPNLQKIAHAYGLPYVCLKKTGTLMKDLEKVLQMTGPVICEVMCLPNDQVIPAASAARREDGTMVSKPLEDMYPFLDRQEFKDNMLVTPVE